VNDLPLDPFERFATLLEDAKRAIPVDPNAMVLATVGADGRPSARVVLLKGFDRRGFVFYTNLESRKAQELGVHPFAALCFHWRPLEQQVRIEGAIERVTDAEADAYFATRARGSQVGAWASKQSQVLASREELEARVAEVEARFAGEEVSRPPFWSGYRLKPDRFEFWTGKPSRLHERERYQHQGDTWSVARLYP
jgi:pyridoxamine 5'-phosphate oxidase